MTKKQANKVLRAASDKDIPFIQSVLNAPDNLGKLEGYSDYELRLAVEDNQTPALIWEEHTTPSGFCLLTLSPKGTKIEELGVGTPNNGIGKRMFPALLEFVQTSEFPAPVWLKVASDNIGAIRFYERHGFAKGALEKSYWARRQGPVADALTMVRL